MKRILLFLTGILGAATAHAVGPLPNEGQATVGMVGNYFFVDDSAEKPANDDFEDFTEIGVSGAYFFRPNVSLMAEAGYSESDTVYRGANVKGYRFQAGIRSHFEELAFWGVRPMAGFGMQSQLYDSSDLNDKKTEGFFYAELGGQKMVADRWMAEAGVRGRMEWQDGWADTHVFAGLSYVFGNQPEPQKSPAPVIAPKPEPAPEPVIVYIEKEPEPEKIVSRVVVSSKTLEFKTGSSDIKPGADLGRLGEFAEAVKLSPDLSLIVEGHTDSTGPAAFNQRLSEQRAESVKNLFVSEFGVSPEAVETRGFGESSPIADNSTEAGRTENRRVEIKIRDNN